MTTTFGTFVPKVGLLETRLRLVYEISEYITSTTTALAAEADRLPMYSQERTAVMSAAILVAKLGDDLRGAL